MDVVLSLLRALIGAVVGFFMLVGSVFTGGSTTVSVTTPAPQDTATSSLSTTSEQIYPGYADLPAGTSAQVASSSLSKPPPKSAPTSSQTTSPKPVASIPATPAEPQYTDDQLNTLARGSLVNLLCTTGSGGSFNPISGSGVIIDSRGIILTNAHVAQYFLLRDYPTKDNVQCVVRVGSPAQNRYTATLLYLPPAWIAQNAQEVGSSSPTGTGQHDYAFLYITGTTNPAGTLPASFPALPMDGGNPDTGQHMLLAAYPAGFLGGIAIALNLYLTSAVATVGQIYSYSGTANVDLFSLGGSVVSQSGSSGGAVVNGGGKLEGLISNEIPADTTAQRDLRAITIGHINRSLEASGQGGILGLLAHDPSTFAASFAATTGAAETKALVDVLTNN